MLIRSYFICCLLCLLPFNGYATEVMQSRDVAFILEKLKDGLGVPWGMAFLSADEMIFTERSGTINLLNMVSAQKQQLKGAPAVYAEGQGGMLDVAVRPGYKPGDWIYFTFVREQGGQGVTVLARARLKAQELIDWQDLLVTKSATDTDYHFGSRIAFDTMGHVFFTIGDRGVRPNGQNLSNHSATVIRLKQDGTIPADNPFVNQPSALAEIWSYGHRNPQGISYDAEYQRLWVIEHGPRGGDEINHVLPGRNYGWPVISYGKEYWGPVAVGESTHKEGMQQPVKQYTPSIAPGSLIHYSGKAFAAWKGNLFAGALKLQHLNRVIVNNKAEAVFEERLLTGLHERIRALAECPRGWIYLSTDSGKIFRIRPVVAKTPPGQESAN